MLSPAPESDPHNILNQSFPSLRDQAKQLVVDFENHVRAGDFESAGVSVDNLISDAHVYSLAVPRVLSSYCSKNPVVSDIAAQILFHRLHWIEPGVLNDLVMPCAISHSQSDLQSIRTREFLYGVSSVAHTIEDKFIKPILDIVNENFYHQASGKPFIDHAVLSHFITKLPPDRLTLALECSLHVVSRLLEKIESGDPLTNSPELPEKLCSLTIAALPELKSFFGAKNTYQKNHYQLGQSIVTRVRECIRALAERFTSDNPPHSTVAYILLLTYPNIDPQVHQETYEAGREISRHLITKSPKLGVLIGASYDELHAEFEAAEASELSISDEIYNQLQMVQSLNYFVKTYTSPEMLRRSRRDPMYYNHKQDYFSQLEQQMPLTIYSPFIQRAQRTLQHWWSGGSETPHSPYD